MTTTCASCGHSGEHITNARGFCTACGNLPTRRPEPVPKRTLACLRCETPHDIGAACAVCAAVNFDPANAKPAPKPRWQMPLPLCLFIATAGSMLHWSCLYLIGGAGKLVSEVPDILRNNPIAPISYASPFNFGLIAGGVAATAIGWFLAYKRHPFLGAASGVSGGMIVTLCCWLLAAAF